MSEVVKADNTKPSKIKSFDISKSEDTMALAQDLNRFIKENKLFTNLQGREYVNVEGWQYAGSRLGILPMVEELINLSDDKVIKYQCAVKLQNLRINQPVGFGIAICTNLEPGKKYFQEYAIASMAQTRAIGKAYRNLLAWIIRAAGYEPIPAEEMDNGTPATVVTELVPTPAKPEATDESKQKAKEANTLIEKKRELLLLLNNEFITEEEKEKTIGVINKLNPEQLDKSIARIKEVIRTRATAQETAS